jgi:uncharacterized protein (UPF0264 family)
MAQPNLLVSVRDAAEAVTALAGGADLIDIKEPSRGSLGRADTATIAAVARVVGGRAPISAALGEIRDHPPDGGDSLPAGIRYAKWGLSGLNSRAWRGRLLEARSAIPQGDLVAVAYADSGRAMAPSPEEVAAFVADSKWPILLVDTFQKDGTTLLDWMAVERVTALIAACRTAGVQIALAGSLSAEMIRQLGHLRPDWFAVRGAACDGGREGVISEARVRQLADLVHSL